MLSRLAITCGAPTPPINGFVSPVNKTTWYSFEVAEFTCDDNYVINGTLNTTCGEDGKFDAFETQCLGEFLIDTL